MKTILTSLFFGLSFSAMAQQSHSAYTSTNINDDGRTMSVQIEGLVNGKEVSYNRRFDVRGMSGADKDGLRSRIFDSLGIAETPKPPKPPKPPKAHTTPNSTGVGEESVIFTCKSCTGRVRLEVSGDNFSLSRETDTKKESGEAFPMTVSMRPGEYTYKYWQNGVLQMQLPFTVKAGEKNEVTVK